MDVSALFVHLTAHELGSLQFSRLRVLTAFVIPGLLTIIGGRSLNLDMTHFWTLVRSSLVGLVLRAFFFFAAMRRLGPQQTNILFATNAPITALFF